MKGIYTDFTAHGPFRLSTDLFAKRQRRVQKKGFWRDGFWRTDPELATLAPRCGCYVFAIRSGKGTTPHYVGLTARRFDREVFNRDNLRKYRHAVRTARRGVPLLFLVAHPVGPEANIKDIAELEDFLIQAASIRNPLIQNVKGIRRPRWRIRGIIRSRPGKPTWAARQLRATLSLRPAKTANKRMQPTARRARRG